MARYSLEILGKDLKEASIEALNRAATTAVSKMSSKIREHFSFTKTKLDEHFEIVSKAVDGKPFVIVKIKGGGSGLIHFKAEQFGKPGRTKKGKTGKASSGVKATVVRGKRQLFRSPERASFIQQVKGNEQVFIRTSEKNAAGKERIAKLFGLSVISLIGAKSGENIARKTLEDTFIKAFEKRFADNIKRKFKY
ncbi:MAG: phage tail protein [Ignavibacteriales bacterium]|nr:phage tail protein [Ignavibacteriales bacterium]